MNKISVVLVEDHDLTRIGLIASLEQSEEIKVVDYAQNGHQGLMILTETKPGGCCRAFSSTPANESRI